METLLSSSSSSSSSKTSQQQQAEQTQKSFQFMSDNAVTANFPGPDFLKLFSSIPNPSIPILGQNYQPVSFSPQFLTPSTSSLFQQPTFQNEDNFYNQLSTSNFVGRLASMHHNNNISSF